MSTVSLGSIQLSRAAAKQACWWPTVHRHIIWFVYPEVVVGSQYTANCRRALYPKPDFAEGARSSAASLFSDCSRLFVTTTPGLKTTRVWHHSPPSSAEVHNAWSFISCTEYFISTRPQANAHQKILRTKITNWYYCYFTEIILQNRISCQKDLNNLKIVLVDFRLLPQRVWRCLPSEMLNPAV